MKEKLQNAFKPAPERFRYTVNEAAREATSLPSPAKRRIGKGWRVAIAVLLIAALIYLVLVLFFTFLVGRLERRLRSSER